MFFQRLSNNYSLTFYDNLSDLTDMKKVNYSDIATVSGICINKKNPQEQRRWGAYLHNHLQKQAVTRPTQKPPGGTLTFVV